MRGKAGLVTGAGSGIGRACALALADAGAAVLVSDIDSGAADETAAAIVERGGRALANQCNVADAGSVQAMVEACMSELGGLDFAVNNAGIAGLQIPVHKYELADWHRIIGVNLTGVFLCLTEELRAMYPRGAGAIVNIASEAALKGSAADAVYTASKHGVAGLTKTAALEAARRGVRVNAVCPGVIETGMFAGSVAEASETYDKAKRLMPVGRLGHPDEVAAAVLWLCSDASSLVMGHLLAVDGGWAVS